MKRTLLLCLLMILVFVSGWGYAETEKDLQVAGPANASNLTIFPIEEGKFLASVTDAQNRPIMGLKEKDFHIRQGGKKAKVLSVEHMEISKEVSLNVVLVVDNSFSMKQRNAIEPLLSALEAFNRKVRPIDNIHVVVFDDKLTTKVGGLSLHAKSIQSNNLAELRTFFRNSFDMGLTDGTYLYDALVVGVDIARKMPKGDHKFLLVFTDGEDLNSSAKTADVDSIATGIENFSSYAIDYMPGPEPDRFLKSFTDKHEGKLWKTASGSDFLPIFNSFTDILLHRYVVTYRFLHPPEGTVTLEPAVVTLEEVTTIDTSPFLNYIFFEPGRSEIPERYALFSGRSEAVDFSEEKLKDPMEKYHQILNILGKRLVDNPEAKITLVGCNANIKEEKGKIDLSRSRAESVRAYLRYVWGIDPNRMEVKAQNLPTAPSTSRLEEGIAENRRVEILSDHPAILDTINSTYTQEVCDTNSVRITPDVRAEGGVASWRAQLLADGSPLSLAEGEGDLPCTRSFDLGTIGYKKLASFKWISAHLEVTDKDGEVFKTVAPIATEVKYIKREERLAQKQGYKVLEKYALILFDFDSTAVKERNKVIVDRITSRMKQFPTAVARVTGHTDNIGKEDYNLKLSEKRARTVYEQMLVSAMSGGLTINHEGVGPNNPLYDNASPEGRALNRTVTVTLEYEVKE